MKIRELRSALQGLDKPEMVEILVEIYKTLPKSLIQEKRIDDIVVDRNGYLEARAREKEAERRLLQADRDDNVTSIQAFDRWKSMPEYAREMLLNNVWCSHCGKTCGLKEYTVEPAGSDIVLRGKCPVCHHDVARYVEVQ